MIDFTTAMELVIASKQGEAMSEEATPQYTEFVRTMVEKAIEGAVKEAVVKKNFSELNAYFPGIHIPKVIKKELWKSGWDIVPIYDRNIIIPLKENVNEACSCEMSMMSRN